jgi:hypothetical protein
MLRASEKVVAVMALAIDDALAPKRPPVSYSPVKFATSLLAKLTTSTEERNLIREEERENASTLDPVPPVKTFDQVVAFSPWYIQYSVAAANSVGIAPDPLIGMAFETPSILVKLLTCNIDAQMFCTEHHYSIFTSALIALLVLTFIGAVFSITQIPVVSTLLSLITFSGLVMFLSFEYGPACMPMIPQCFFASMVADVAYFFPTKITIPHSMLACGHDQSESVPSAECIIPCSSEPFRFTDFSANLAWIVCGLSEEVCRSMEQFLLSDSNLYASVVGIDASKKLETALYRSRTVLASEDTNIISGFTWCHYLTLYQIIPLATIVVFTISGVPLIVAAVMKSLVGLFRTTMSAYALSHVD